MYIYGHYYNRHNERISVHIVTHNSREQQVEIGAKGGDLFFTDDPVDITSQVNDTFDVLLCNQASIRLLTHNFMPELFCANFRDAKVNIFRNSTLLFAGYIEPQTYSQGYNEEFDEVELTCIDALCALQYTRYRNIGCNGTTYGDVKTQADLRSFWSIVEGILKGITKDLDLCGELADEGGMKVLYDISKMMPTAILPTDFIMRSIGIHELLFLGDDEDGVWTEEDVLTEILQYLSLHIVQDGLTFRIFSWETLKMGDKIIWLEPALNDFFGQVRTSIDITTQNVADCDTTISVGEVYNQLLLTCNSKTMESLIESPLDNELLSTPYANKQLYMTEYCVDDVDKPALEAFYDMTHGKATSHSKGRITDWYIQVMSNDKWTFPAYGGGDLYELYTKDGTRQHDLPYSISQQSGAAIIAFGKNERKTGEKTEQVASKIDMKNYMVVTVNGKANYDNPDARYPNEGDLIARMPMAVYNGNITGGVLSPSDDATTNYIVISGKIALNPKQPQTDRYTNIKIDIANSPTPMRWNGDGSYTYYTGYMQWWRQVVRSSHNPFGAYRTCAWYSAYTPLDKPAVFGLDKGLSPLTESVPANMNGKVNVARPKIPILRCMLVIGNRVLVEKPKGGTLGTDTPGTGYGKIDDFVWMPYKTEEQCSSKAEYYSQCFTIGFYMEDGDNIIGQQYDLQNNVTHEMGIDAEGIAIPLRKSDNLAGKVQFKILGPVNLLMKNVNLGYSYWTRTEDSDGSFKDNFFSGTNKLDEAYIMPEVGSIFMEEFEVKIYSDNGLVNNTADNDVVYVSDTVEQFVNRKDDITFRICSDLTTQEKRDMGVTDSIKMSTPVDMVTKAGLLYVFDYNRQLKAKPEQLYVDSYYREYHEPRVEMTQKMEDLEGGLIDRFAHYRHPYMGKDFFVVGISRNLTEGYAELKLKEIET